MPAEHGFDAYCDVKFRPEASDYARWGHAPRPFAQTGNQVDPSLPDWRGLIDRSLLPPRAPAPTDWAGKPSILGELHRRFGLGEWQEPRWDELRATYYGMCARVDHQLGLLIETLRAAGMWDDTALLFFSDHGDFTGDYDLTTWSRRPRTRSRTPWSACRSCSSRRGRGHRPRAASARRWSSWSTSPRRSTT
ncbi:MAG: sulfatase-like hydrolase/transferase [Spirochaetaceae bacterium]|nr:sulfatase-like hydrolase/transferase [Spirochaetaceae bacterium]